MTKRCLPSGMSLRMWLRLLLLSGFAAAAFAQEDPGSGLTHYQDPQDLLVRVRRNLIETIGTLPKYMCTLTIDRAQYQVAGSLGGVRGSQSCDALLAGKLLNKEQKGRPKPRLYETDRLRLDVAISDSSREIYSWVGEDRFDDRGLFQIVNQGALQTGSYSTFLSSIFRGTAASFSYDGDVMVDGRRLVEFGFQVPLEKSNYIFGNWFDHVTTAYGGTFLVDPKTGDLTRLVVHTSQLPPDVGSCQATTTLDYTRVRLNDLEFLLPRKAQLDIINTDSAEFHNRTEYSACHEFLGESSVRFDDPLPASEKTASTSFSLPAGIPFTVEFTQVINPAAAVAGDRIKSKLTRAIRDPSSHVLVPEGSEVTARIVKLQHFLGPPSSFAIGIKLETVNVGGVRRPFTATAASAAGRFEKQTGLGQRVQLGSLDALEDRGVKLFEFRDTPRNRVIDSGYETTWTTAATP
jgi:hypothetical protein